MFLNMHAKMLYSIVWGDKDTYRLAFHLAGKIDGFAQVFQPYKSSTLFCCICKLIVGEARSKIRPIKSIVSFSQCLVSYFT